MWCPRDFNHPRNGDSTRDVHCPGDGDHTREGVYPRDGYTPKICLAMFTTLHYVSIVNKTS